jgi:hypothetical protein
MDAGTLYDAIIPVCPIETTRVGVADDRSTWTYEAKAGATAQQKAAADNVIATIPIDTLGSLATSEFISRWTNAEYRKLLDRRMADNGKLGKDWDVTTADGSIPLDKQRTQNLKADLVTQAILTQARADEIFS